MTYILELEDDLHSRKEFASEKDAVEWAKEHVSRRDLHRWTLLDPEGDLWELFF